MRMPNVVAMAATRRHSVGPPDHDASKLQKSTAPATKRSRQAASGEFALAGADRLTAHQPYVTHRQAIVRPFARLLEPEQSMVGDASGELDGFVHLPCLIGVGHQHEVVAGGAAGFDEPLGVLGRRQPADFELHAGQPARLKLGDLLGDADTGAVIAADRGDGDRVAVPTPQPPEGLSRRLADGVPDRRVDARAGHQSEAAITQDVERRRPRLLPTQLHGAGIEADQLRSDLVADDARDLLEAGVLVAGVRLTDDSRGRVHLGDDRRAMGHAVLAAAIRSVERDANRDEVDSFDRQGTCRARRRERLGGQRAGRSR